MGALTPTSILAGLRAHGARLHLVGDRVHVDGVRPEELPQELVAAAREHRDDLRDELQREAEADQIPVSAISLVQAIFPGCRILGPDDPRPTKTFEVIPLPEYVSRQGGEIPLDRGDWSGGEWLAVYLERAAVLEYEGGLSRSEAEAIALAELGEEWVRHEIAMAWGSEP